MIHRQETVGLLGVPLYRFIDIDDSEAVLRAIRMTPDETPIDLLLHTPGGLVLASEQIAYALHAHPGKVTVLVPHYAMSGGTLLALAADEILMDEAAVLGPVDPQLGDMPAASLVRVAGKKPLERLDDRTLVMADVAEKALRHMKQVVRGLLVERLGDGKGGRPRRGAGRRPLHARRPDHAGRGAGSSGSRWSRGCPPRSTRSWICSRRRAAGGRASSTSRCPCPGAGRRGATGLPDTGSAQYRWKYPRSARFGTRAHGKPFQQRGNSEVLANNAQETNTSVTAVPDRPLLLFFTNRQSGPARRMESLLSHLARKERARIRISRVDVDERARPRRDASRGRGADTRARQRPQAGGPPRGPCERAADRGADRALPARASGRLRGGLKDLRELRGGPPPAPHSYGLPLTLSRP